MRHRRRVQSALLAGAAVATLIATGGAGASATTAKAGYPVLGSLAAGIAASIPNPAAPPAGVNVAGCRPSAEHPRPVVLVNGTFANMIDDWAGLGPVLANSGYCVYGTAIGGNPHLLLQTVGSAVGSAKQISSRVDEVLAETGADSVDLVGHSQGGMISEYYTKLLGGADKVHSVVALSPTSHGTSLLGLGKLAEAFPGGPELVNAACPACADQLQHSDVITALNDGPITQDGVKYTVVETRNEFVVTPVGSSFIDEPGVTNQWVQDYCGSSNVDHLSLPYDRTVQTLVKNALDPDHAQPATC